MDNTKKMLTAIINGQSAMKADLITKIDDLDKKLGGVANRLTKRIDEIGLQFARLEDDAPTREEFDELKQNLKN